MGRKTYFRCQCSPDCVGQTTRTFAQGHDARMVGKLTRAALQGECSADEAEQQARRLSPILASKVRWAINRERDKQERRRQRAAARNSDRLDREAVQTASDHRSNQTSSDYVFSANDARVMLEDDAEHQARANRDVVAKVGRWTYTGQETTPPDGKPFFTYLDKQDKVRTAEKYTVLEDAK